jgi:uncharacterized protein YbaR (Trm112 family)
MPYLDSQFVGLLRCPASRSPLKEASLEQLARLGMSQVQCAGWDAGLLRTDGRGAYPLRKGIPVLLAEELVPLHVDAAPPAFASPPGANNLESHGNRNPTA